MLIKAIDVKPLAVPLAESYHWRFGADGSAQLVLFEVETEDGQRGYGESVCVNLEAGHAYGRVLSAFFLGRPVHEVARIRQEIWNTDRWSVTPRVTNQILAGLEAACWDVWGKSLGLPVAALLGGALREKVDFFGFVQGDNEEVLSRSADALRSRGFRTFYLKVGRSPESDAAAVAAVRAAIGNDARLRIDPNEAWDVPTAIHQIRKLEGFDLDWVEQPVAGENVVGLAEVRRAVSTSIAADNAVYSVGELRAVLTHQAADAIVLSAHESGGLLRWQQMAMLADAFGIPINRKGYLESEISTFAAMQAMAVVPNLSDGNQLTHQLLAQPLTKTAIEIRDGKAQIPTEPGLGFAIDEASVEEAHERYKRSADGASGNARMVVRG
jgi:glucarate dehydratase